MYDDVDIEIECPCGAIVKDFQSKDGPCLLAKVSLSCVDNFYGICPKCKTWIEFFRKEKSNDIKDFEMVVKDKSK